MTTFQRARNDEQRAERRRAILDAAAAMLAEMPVAEVSLNELSRRVGLAKSNVLRYFESREAVLLELLERGTREWLAGLGEPAGGGDPQARFVTLLAESLARRPVLCDLLAARAGVLERNVSTAVVVAHKRASLDQMRVLAGLARRHVPDLTPPAAERFAAGVVLVTGAVGAQCRPVPAVEAAYATDPSLAVMRFDLREVLAEFLAILLAGVLARPPVDLLF